MLEKRHGGGVIDQQRGIICRRKRAPCPRPVLNRLNLQSNAIITHQTRPHLRGGPVFALPLDSGGKREINWSLFLR